MGYGSTKEAYVSSGERDINGVLRVLDAFGHPVTSMTHILDHGCGAGRMITWPKHVATTCEIWGADIGF